MNLYKILVQHFTLQDPPTNIEKYIIAKNDEAVFEYLDKITEWSSRQEHGVLYDLPDEYLKNTSFEKLDKDDFELTDTEIEELYTIWKKYIISTKGEINSDWADYIYTPYFTKHYGWELIKEGIGDMEIQVLKRLNII
jgi:hypothetical protein